MNRTTWSRSLRALPWLAALGWCVPAPGAAQSLRGSPASVRRMYTRAQSRELHFHRSSRDIARSVQMGRLVAVEPSAYLALAEVSHPVALPTTQRFVERLAAQYHRACGERLVVTSATRTTAWDGPGASDRSVHPTGMAVDLRRSRRLSCRRWLRRTLRSLEGRGIVEATEEHHPAHFHVAVYPRRYRTYLAARGLPAPATARRVAVYRVRTGDSLWKIAKRRGTTVRRLRTINHLRDNVIVPGQRLRVPGAGG